MASEPFPSRNEIEREKRQAGMIINRWQPWFRQQYGGDLPDSYMTADLETSGFSRENDLILEWGHCMVEDRKVVDKLSFMINWYASDAVPPDWLDRQLQRVAKDMQLANKPWHLTKERLQAEGVEPQKALPWIHGILSNLRQSKTLIVMHNGLNFDAEMLVACFAKDLGIEFAFGPNAIFDTSAVEKASQLLDNPRVMPKTGESMADYFKRIANWRAPGVYHNLAQHCIQKYQLDKKYGIDPSKMHSAGEDAYVTHLLFEEFRKLAGVSGCVDNDFLPKPNVTARPLLPPERKPTSPPQRIVSRQRNR